MLWEFFANVSELHNVTFNIMIFCSDSSIELLDDMCAEPQDVAEKWGVSRTTIYHYLENQ